MLGIQMSTDAIDKTTLKRVTTQVRAFVPRSYDHELIAMDILFESWTNKINHPTTGFVRRRCIDAMRKDTRERKLVEKMGVTKDANREQQDIQDRDQINQLVRVLDPFERKIVWYRFYQDMPLVEIAESVSQDVNVIRETLLSAIFKMKQAGA